MENARPSNTKVNKEIFNPLLILMILMYPIVLGFVFTFTARLATFVLLIPTPTVPGTDDASGKLQLHGADDLWETGGAGAIVRTTFGLTSIVVVHLFVFCYLVGGPLSVFRSRGSDTNE